MGIRFEHPKKKLARVRVPQRTSAAPKRTSILVQVCKRAHPSNPHFDFVYFTIYSHVIFSQNHTFSPPKKAGVDKNTDLANQRPKNWTQSSRGQRSDGTADYSARYSVSSFIEYNAGQHVPSSSFKERTGLSRSDSKKFDKSKGHVRQALLPSGIWLREINHP